MAQYQLNLKNLQELDNGKCAAAFNHAIRSIVADINDRPADRAKRKAVLTVMATPILHRESAVLENVNIQFRIEAKTPVRQTSEYPMKPTNDGLLLFQSESPFDPNQMGLPYEPAAESVNGDGEDDSAEGDEPEVESI